MSQNFSQTFTNFTRKTSSTKSLNSQIRKNGIENYEILNDNENIGQGAFGTVQKAKNVKTGSICAIKKLWKTQLIAYQEVESVKSEVKLHKKLNFPHIIQLYDYFEDSSYVYLVMQFAENGSLFQYMRKNGKIPEKQAFLMFIQILSAINYIHSKNIIHRDIKPENILLDEDFNIKLCDFGYSKNFSQDRTSYCGTKDYLPPEIIDGSVQTYKADTWCLGNLLFEILFGFPPIRHSQPTRQEMINHIKQFTQNIYFEPRTKVSQEAKDLISQLMSFKPQDRPNIQDIIKHPWVQNNAKKFNFDPKNYIFNDQQPYNLLKQYIFGNSQIQQQGENSVRYSNSEKTPKGSPNIRIQTQQENRKNSNSNNNSLDQQYQRQNTQPNNFDNLRTPKQLQQNDIKHSQISNKSQVSQSSIFTFQQQQNQQMQQQRNSKERLTDKKSYYAPQHQLYKQNDNIQQKIQDQLNSKLNLKTPKNNNNNHQQKSINSAISPSNSIQNSVEQEYFPNKFLNSNQIGSNGSSLNRIQSENTSKGSTFNQSMYNLNKYRTQFHTRSIPQSPSQNYSQQLQQSHNNNNNQKQQQPDNFDEYMQRQPPQIQQQQQPQQSQQDYHDSQRKKSSRQRVKKKENYDQRQISLSRINSQTTIGSFNNEQQQQNQQQQSHPHSAMTLYNLKTNFQNNSNKFQQQKQQSIGSCIQYNKSAVYNQRSPYQQQKQQQSQNIFNFSNQQDQMQKSQQQQQQQRGYSYDNYIKNI